MISHGELNKCLRAGFTFNSCLKIVQSIKDKRYEINRKMKGKGYKVGVISTSNVTLRYEFGFIMEREDLLYIEYEPFLDGNIQSMMVSDSEEQFLLGYEILVSKGLITRI